MKAKTWIAGVLLVVSGSASAQQPTTVLGESRYTERVAYRISDLASSTGIRDLRSRVRSAAHRVCAPDRDTLAIGYSENSCYGPTVDDAMAQVDQVVARLARGETPRASRIVVAAR